MQNTLIPSLTTLYLNLLDVVYSWVRAAVILLFVLRYVNLIMKIACKYENRHQHKFRDTNNVTNQQLWFLVVISGRTGYSPDMILRVAINIINYENICTKNISMHQITCTKYVQISVSVQNETVICLCSVSTYSRSTERIFQVQLKQDNKNLLTYFLDCIKLQFCL